MSRWRDLLPTLKMLVVPVAMIMARWLRHGIRTLGVLALVMIVLAFTRVPFDAHRWLGLAEGTCLGAPNAIVVLGGSGMPSGPELLRLEHAAHLAIQWPHAQVVVVHPGDPGVIQLMMDELVLRGVDTGRIIAVNEGDNTRAQAMACQSRISWGEASVVIVTAPENTYRSVRVFRKAGFPQVCGSPAWDHAMFHDFAYDHARIGGKTWMPDVSEDPALRYTFWNYLKLEITCLREAVAIAYYRANGWI
ncbi:MAG TPA: YdcF family protein [Flavobacteriales bacterium]|nr:YdcF family protein [Flavobacteriales bacterium]